MAIIIAVVVGQGFCLHNRVLVPDGAYLINEDLSREGKQQSWSVKDVETREL